jgi:FdhE protein
MMTTDNQKILTRLKELKTEQPGLAEMVDLQHALLEAQSQLELPPAHPTHRAEDVQARFQRGVPLIRPQEMAIDWDTFAGLYRQICHIVGQHRPDLSDQIEKLLVLPDDDPDGVKNLATAYLEQGGLEVWQDATEQDAQLLTFVFNNALRPFLKRYADALAPMIEQRMWQKRQCPVCGAEPDMAFLDKDAGARHLVCSRCDTCWLFPRIRCPFCNTGEPKHLSYFASEDEKYRLYVCQNCKRYLKTADLRKMQRRIIFSVERIATVALDVAAQEKGYR